MPGNSLAETQTPMDGRAGHDSAWIMLGATTHLQQELIGTAVPHLDLSCVISQLSLAGNQLLDMPRLLVSYLRSAEARCDLGARTEAVSRAPDFVAVQLSAAGKFADCSRLQKGKPAYGACCQGQVSKLVSRC